MRAKLIEVKSNQQLYSEGLRSYMIKVFNYMTLGLIVSALAAFIGAHQPVLGWLYSVTPTGIGLSAFGWLVLIAPFIIIFMFSSAVGKLNVGKAQTLFWVFSGLMGLSLSSVLLLYSGVFLTKVFLISAATFAGFSLYGYTTQKDLTSFQSFLTVGLWGVIIASIVNFFMKSASLDYAISIIGVLVFVGLTAFDTQRIKAIYNEAPTDDHRQAAAISGALALYLDFINLFLFLLRIMSDRR